MAKAQKREQTTCIKETKRGKRRKCTRKSVVIHVGKRRLKRLSYARVEIRRINQLYQNHRWIENVLVHSFYYMLMGSLSLSDLGSGLHAPVCLENCKNDKRIARRRKKLTKFDFHPLFCLCFLFGSREMVCKKDDCMVYNTRDLIICASIWLRSKRTGLMTRCCVCVGVSLCRMHTVCTVMHLRMVKASIRRSSRKKEHTCK